MTLNLRPVVNATSRICPKTWRSPARHYRLSTLLEKKEGTLQRASHLDIPLNVIPQLVLIKHDSLKLGRSVGPTVSCMINGCSCGLLFIYREINSNMGEKSAFSIHRGTSLYLFSINKCIDHSPYRD